MPSGPVAASRRGRKTRFGEGEIARLRQALDKAGVRREGALAAAAE